MFNQGSLDKLKNEHKTCVQKPTKGHKTCWHKPKEGAHDLHLLAPMGAQDLCEQTQEGAQDQREHCGMTTKAHVLEQYTSCAARILCAYILCYLQLNTPMKL